MIYRREIHGRRACLLKGGGGGVVVVVVFTADPAVHGDKRPSFG